MPTTITNNTGDTTSGQHYPVWIDAVKPLKYETLNKDVDTQVLIVGGGISGLTTAYCLAREGKKVVLLEDGFLGSGETGRTTAHLTCALDDRYYELEKIFGEDGARLAAQSHSAAIDWIEKTVAELNIDCNFKRLDGFLFLHSSDKKENLEKEFDATKKVGLNTEWLPRVPGIKSETNPCIRFPDQAQFHVMKYLKGLADAITALGVKIYTQSRARHIDEKGAACNGYKITAEDIVVATNSPVNDFATMHMKQMPFRTYVIGATIRRGLVTPSLWWDTGNMDSKWYTAPYHYVRTVEYNNEFDLLLAGGEDHKTGQADDEKIPEEERYKNLISWTRKRFPDIADIVYQWSGQVLEPLDYLAFIGKNPGNDNVYIITGESGNGMTHGTLGGLIISDLILKKENPWEKIYSPKRLPLKLPGKFLKELTATAVQYADYLTGADIKETEELGADEGAVLKKGFKYVAVYKDGQNMLYTFSAVCPHMGCVLQWNAYEKTFDCPCHGSRFTKMGTVINGPATANLQKIELPL